MSSLVIVTLTDRRGGAPPDLRPWLKAADPLTAKTTRLIL